MKTSLNIDNDVFDAAKLAALQTGRPVSEIISRWAAIGYEAVSGKAAPPKNFSPADLGGAPRMDLTRRKDWMDALDDDRA